MPETNDAQRKILEKIGESKPRYAKCRQYREYYDGKHETMLTERQRKYLQIKTGQEFNDNYTPIVVDALAERLIVTGFSVSGDDETANKNQAQMFNDWWKTSRLDASQSDVHAAAIRDSDAYVLIEWDNENNRPSITFEPAYDGSEGAEIVYNPDKRRVPLYAWKRWKSEDTQRLNVYFPDRVEKYIRSDAGEDAGQGDWDLESVGYWGKIGDSTLKPGIPLFHFRNRSDGYNYGKSELHDVIPLQNALNKSIIDLVAAADTTGFRLYWMTGGDPSAIEIVPGSWIYSTDPDTNIGHIPGEDLSKLIDFKDSFAMEIARVSRTPLSFFQLTRQVSSEGTLKQQESGLVSRAKKRQVEFGNTWEDVMRFCCRLWNIYQGETLLDEEVMIDTQWEDPETRDDRGRLEELQIKVNLGIPQEQIWTEMGYDIDQIEKFKAMDEYTSKSRRGRYENIEAALKAGLSPEAAMRDAGMSDEDIAKYYAELPEQ